MTIEQEKEVNILINNIINKNENIIREYRNGKKGLIGVIMKKIIKESAISFNSKNNKEKLIVFLKKKMNE